MNWYNVTSCKPMSGTLPKLKSNDGAILEHHLVGNSRVRRVFHCGKESKEHRHINCIGWYSTCNVYKAIGFSLKLFTSRTKLHLICSCQIPTRNVLDACLRSFWVNSYHQNKKIVSIKQRSTFHEYQDQGIAL